MRLFKNANFTDFYTEPPTLSLEEILYVEINLERPLISDLSVVNVSLNFSKILSKIYLNILMMYLILLNNLEMFNVTCFDESRNSANLT